MALRRHLGQISQSRRRAYPSPNDPPPIGRCVIGTEQRGHWAPFPATNSSRIRCSSIGVYCALPSLIQGSAPRPFRRVARPRAARTPAVLGIEDRINSRPPEFSDAIGAFPWIEGTLFKNRI